MRISSPPCTCSSRFVVPLFIPLFFIPRPSPPCSSSRPNSNFCTAIFPSSRAPLSRTVRRIRRKTDSTIFPSSRAPLSRTERRIRRKTATPTRRVPPADPSEDSTTPTRTRRNFGVCDGVSPAPHSRISLFFIGLSLHEKCNFSLQSGPAESYSTTDSEEDRFDDEFHDPDTSEFRRLRIRIVKLFATVYFASLHPVLVLLDGWVLQPLWMPV